MKSLNFKNYVYKSNLIRQALGGLLSLLLAYLTFLFPMQYPREYTIVVIRNIFEVHMTADESYIFFLICLLIFIFTAIYFLAECFRPTREYRFSDQMITLPHGTFFRKEISILYSDILSIEQVDRKNQFGGIIKSALQLQVRQGKRYEILFAPKGADAIKHEIFDFIQKKINQK